MAWQSTGELGACNEQERYTRLNEKGSFGLEVWATTCDSPLLLGH